MNLTEHRTPILGVLLMLILFPLNLHGQRENQYQQQIESIAQKISSISKSLNTDKAMLKTERDQLFKEK